ncbi:MAG: hypothetical protein HXX80_05050 [Nitrososphaerales archaeon]|nr:hypothetical protein [Nitrososphaerales archaeon]
MSSLEHATRFLVEAEPEDWWVLHAMEKLISSYERIPIDQISRVSGLDKDEVEFRLGRLGNTMLVICSESGHSLTSAGLDAIALNSLAKRKLVSAIGKPMSTGKESDIVKAIDDLGKEYAIKFYRLGRINFRAVRKKCEYASSFTGHHWLVVNLEAAKKEYDALRRLHPLGVPVPEATARERHAILMKKLGGSLLSDIKTLDHPVRVLRNIIESAKLAYTLGGMVNCDLSEHNIICNGEKIWMIDWPQYVEKGHPNSSKLLDRDLLNILGFFRKRFMIDCKLEATTFYVRGWSDRLEIF